MIRRYLESDRAQLVRMSVALFPEASATEHERDLDAWFARDDVAVFVAQRSDGSIAGFVQVGERPYVDGCDSSPVGYIEAWYVDADVRRTGFGRALLNAAEDWAAERGRTEMGSDVLLDNEVSYRAHRNSGYVEVERVVHLRKALQVTEVSASVRAEAVSRLTPIEAMQFIRRLERTILPLLDRPEMARDRDRVHLAILKLVEKDRHGLDRHVSIAANDWRDTLVAAGM